MQDIDDAVLPPTRGYQQEMLDESLQRNIIIALDTGSGKTHIAVLRIKIEADRELKKISWFVAPTVGLCEQQREVISTALPVSVGIISGALEPEQWKNPTLWRTVLETHRIMVSTPQVLLDALRHGYVNLGRDIGLLIFDEAHHAADKHPYNMILREFYDICPPRVNGAADNRSVIRPFILGLTASPVFGGNVERAFEILERNMDCKICGPRQTRAELAEFVHRPVFKHVLYPEVQYNVSESASRNVRELARVFATLDIEEDPYVQSLRAKLSKLATHSIDYTRTDQRLSKTINKKDSFTHKGLRDFVRAAEEICFDLGTWAADWYVQRVLEHATTSANPFQNMFADWQSREKAYLLNILSQISVTAVSYDAEAIRAGTSPKANALITCLQSEKAEWESYNDVYSSLIFVTRRDSVLALAELLMCHPSTKSVFTIGCLLGSSDNSKRRTFLDITRNLLRQPQAETLNDFRIGEKTLLVSTAVAEEGIDIQACGSVIRWDPPQNMVSWAQSRGRARRSRSSFTLMFEDGGVHKKLVQEWETLEAKMVALYTDEQRRMQSLAAALTNEDEGEEEEYLEYRVEKTGALLTLDSAVSHLAHFCAVLPSSSHIQHQPIYDIDPLDYPTGYHAAPIGSMKLLPYTGPFGATVTLPKLLPPDKRVYTTDRIHGTKLSARRHVAFKAYIALYEAGLLNDSLLPLTSVVEPDLEQEVKDLLRDVEKRHGVANVTGQMKPWEPSDAGISEERWWTTDITIGGISTITMLSRINVPTLDLTDILYDPEYGERRIHTKSCGPTVISPGDLIRAKEYTRGLFYVIYGARMSWDDLDFAYLFLPFSNDGLKDPIKSQWRHWADEQRQQMHNPAPQDHFFVDAQLFGFKFSYPNDLFLVSDRTHPNRPYKFTCWRTEPLSTEEHEKVLAYYARYDEVNISYPVIVAHPLPQRMNFLVPTGVREERDIDSVIFLPQFTTFALVPAIEIRLAMLLPSTLRAVVIALTAHSLRSALFASTSLSAIPFEYLKEAITAPVAQEIFNYQRLETLGDTVLKFIVGVQLLSRYPLWHEGYLTKRKDHTVSNARLARAAVLKGLYRWIVRDRFLVRRWKPEYYRRPAIAPRSDTVTGTTMAGGTGPRTDAEASQKHAADEALSELSTKTLADVVESLIGAAYIEGGFAFSIECARVFDLGLQWEPLPSRVADIYKRTEDLDAVPDQLAYVEQMLGYKFKKKIFLVEALMHASYQHDLHTVSYERMEFLGDSVLDMIVTEWLYRAPGKKFSPGQLHIRKSALVNGHFLAFICLRCSLQIEAGMPQVLPKGEVTITKDIHTVYLWQCLLHSSHRILDDLRGTFTRFQRGRAEIEDALHHKSIYPWAALTKLQAPKFFSDIVESLIGAVYIDSNGDMEAAKQVLEKLGILPILRHVVHDNVDVRHPVSRVANWAAQNGKEVDYHFEQKHGNITCRLLLDEQEVKTVTERYKGRASREEVRFRVAEEAIKILSKVVQDKDASA